MNHTVELSVRKVNDVIAPDTQTFFNNQILLVRKVPVSLESLTRVTTTATATLKNHGLEDGDSVEIEAVAPFDGTFTVTVLNSDQFTYTVLNSGATTDPTAKLYQTRMWYNQFLGPGNQPPVYTVAQSITELEALLPDGFAAIGTVIREGETNTRLITPYSAAFPSFAGIQLINNVSASLGIQSITRDSSTATVTTSVDHGLQTGDYVTISGAVETEYNGTYQITVTGVDTYTYTVSGTPDSPATGTIVYVVEGCRIQVYEERYANWFYDLRESYAVITALYDGDDNQNIAAGFHTTASLTTAALTLSAEQTIVATGVEATDVVSVTLVSYAGTLNTEGVPIVFNAAAGTDEINFFIYNIHATNALAETVTVQYTVTRP